MTCASYVSNRTSAKISQLILKKELQSLILCQKTSEEKINENKVGSLYFVYKEIFERCQQCIEKIIIMNEEMECYKLLSSYVDTLEQKNTALALKSKWLIDENRWLESQVAVFETELKKLDQEWIQLELERNCKLYFYKMRNFENYIDVNEEIEMSSTNNNEYEPDELYSSDIQPFFKIVKENMLEWRNELAIAWCNEILTMFIEKEGEASENVADLYSFIGRIYKLNNQFEKAKYYFEKAVLINKVIGNKNQKGVNQTFLGILYAKEKNYEKAERYFKSALICREPTLGKEHPDISDLFCRLGNIYNKTGKWNDSIENYLRALPVLEKLCDMDSQLFNLYLTLSDDYTELKMEDKSYAYMEKYCRLSFKQRSIDNVIFISPITNLLQKNESNVYKNAVLNLLITYGPVQRCCSKEFLIAMSKYFVIFNHRDASHLLREWCEMSRFPYELIKPSFINDDIRRPASSQQFRRSSSKNSICSTRSNKLKNLRVFLNSPMESVRNLMM